MLSFISQRVDLNHALDPSGKFVPMDSNDSKTHLRNQDHENKSVVLYWPDVGDWKRPFEPSSPSHLHSPINPTEEAQ